MKRRGEFKPYVSFSVKRGIMDARVKPGHDAEKAEAP
jgi:hypothetical protein